METAVPTVERVAYETCPICESDGHAAFLRAPCHAHPLWHAMLPKSMEWHRCGACGHEFTSGWFDDDGMAALAMRANAQQDLGSLDSRQAEGYRRISSRIVDRIVQALGRLEGRWLDVGVGNGALLAAADEFGFDAVGIDLRSEPVLRLQELGYKAEAVRFEHLDEENGFDVISMADVLEHIAFPRVAVAKAATFLKPGGLLFVSMPNTASLTWKLMDRAGVNPYWAELEHFHNFDRPRLESVLAEAGLDTIGYSVSERYLAGMELIARKG